jgi:hypothetical protein
MKLQELKQKLTSGTQTLPYSVRSEGLKKLEIIGRKLKEIARGSLRYISFQNNFNESLYLNLLLFIGP